MVPVESLKRRRRTPFFAALLLILLIIVPAATSHRSSQDKRHSMKPSKGVHEPRNEGGGYGNPSGKVVETNRVWGDRCSEADLMLVQGPTAPMDTGIPTYTVEIVNVCATRCNISEIHLSCAWFSSARLINPKVFRRLRYDDCLVNDGKPLRYGHSVSFQYANSFSYPLSVMAVNC